jgi:phage terminase large subunit-like protein
MGWQAGTAETGRQLDYMADSRRSRLRKDADRRRNGTVLGQTNKYVNLIGATADDVRDIMVEVKIGILAVCPKDERALYKKSDRQLQ